MPGSLGDATAAWLLAEAECHEAVPEVSDSAGRVLSSIAEEISGAEVEVDFSVTVSTLDKAVAFAGEVLALTERHQARGDVYVYLTDAPVRRTSSAMTTKINIDNDGEWNPVGVEVLGAVKVTIDGRVVLPTPDSPEDLVEAVAREICNVGRDHDLWASDEVGESAREDLRAEARAAISVMQLPGGLINPAVQDVRLTPDELAALEARFKAQRSQPPTVLGRPTVTRAQVRAAASALFEWNNELPDDPRFTLHHVTGGVDREPYGALVDEVLHHLGIRVQEGQQ